MTVLLQAPSGGSGRQLRRVTAEGDDMTVLGAWMRRRFGSRKMGFDSNRFPVNGKSPDRNDDEVNERAMRTMKPLSVPVFLLLVAAVFLSFQNQAFAAVAHDAASESHAGTTGSTNQASFPWPHTPAGTPRGVLVNVFTRSATQTVTGVTYGGVAMTAVAGGVAVDTGGEPGRGDAFFLGAAVPPGA